MRLRELTLGLVTMLALAATSCAPPRPVQSFSAPPTLAGETGQLAVVGDMRDDDGFFRHGSNEAVCRHVMEAIAADAPDLVVITGDLVADASLDDWERFDSLTATLRERSIPAIAAIGNHEYEGSRKDAEARYFARFPAIRKQLWYTVRFGPTALVLIDTTENKLTQAEWAEQRTWYESTLAALDGDAAVRGVLVLAHHPPFTNSTESGDEESVRATFVPAFLRAKKTLAYLGGHVHNYERFEREGKVFIVSGGGGAPPAALAVGAARRHLDDLFAGPPLRPYHFVMYTLAPWGLAAEVRAVPEGEPRRTIDHFELRYR